LMDYIQYPNFRPQAISEFDEVPDRTGNGRSGRYESALSVSSIVAESKSQQARLIFRQAQETQHNIVNLGLANKLGGVPVGLPSPGSMCLHEPPGSSAQFAAHPEVVQPLQSPAWFADMRLLVDARTSCFTLTGTLCLSY